MAVRGSAWYITEVETEPKQIRIQRHKENED